MGVCFSFFNLVATVILFCTKGLRFHKEGLLCVRGWGFISMGSVGYSSLPRPLLLFCGCFKDAGLSASQNRVSEFCFVGLYFGFVAKFVVVSGGGVLLFWNWTSRIRNNELEHAICQE